MSFDIEINDYVTLKRSPSTIWKVAEVQYKPPTGWSYKNSWLPRARLEWELSPGSDAWEKACWTALEDLTKLNEMEVIARMV